MMAAGPTKPSEYFYFALFLTTIGTGEFEWLLEVSRQLNKQTNKSCPFAHTPILGSALAELEGTLFIFLKRRHTSPNVFVIIIDLPRSPYGQK